MVSEGQVVLKSGLTADALFDMACERGDPTAC